MVKRLHCEAGNLGVVSFVFTCPAYPQNERLSSRRSYFRQRSLFSNPFSYASTNLSKGPLLGVVSKALTASLPLT